MTLAEIYLTAVQAIVWLVFWGCIVACVLCGLWVAVVIILAFGRRAVSRQPVTVYCLPCNGEPGPCTCKAKADCEHPLCGAADTGVLDIDAEWAELMRREGGQR